MKINRSSKCSVKFATRAKRLELQKVLSEYGRVVNIFIEHSPSCHRRESKGLAAGMSVG